MCSSDALSIAEMVLMLRSFFDDVRVRVSIPTSDNGWFMKGGKDVFVKGARNRGEGMARKNSNTFNGKDILQNMIHFITLIV